MKGKSAVVTGGTCGIGRQTALGLARLGARVVIVGRDAGRTQAAQAWLSERVAGAQIETEVADLSSVAQVRELARRLHTRCERLDVLVNNAGGLFPKFLRSADGLELTWALNHLGYFALTLELKPLLFATGGARVVNVVSKLHKRAGNVFYDPQWLHDNGRGYSGSVAYARSKLANILFTYALSERWRAAGVSVNCVSPGIVGTGLNRNMPLPVRLLTPLFNRIALTPEQGAQTSVYAATDSELDSVSGKYFYKKQPIESSPASYDAGLQQELWNLSLEQTGLYAD